MNVGYARTSTVDQLADLKAQERDLRTAGCEKLFSGGFQRGMRPSQPAPTSVGTTRFNMACWHVMRQDALSRLIPQA